MPEHQDTACRLVIIGAGLESLCIISRLPQQLLQDTVVVDTTGEWLGSWSKTCQNLQIEHLRSPITLHPAAAPLELKSYIEKQGLDETLQELFSGYAPAPTAKTMQDFCKERIIDKIPKSLEQPIKDTVVDVQLLSPDASPTSGTCTLHLESGKTISAKATVVAYSNLRPVIPSWAKNFVTSEKKEHSCPSLKTWDQIDLTTKSTKDKSIAIVGGGMIAAHLALGALQNNPKVKIHVISRRALRQQPFECDVCWWGMKQLNTFWQNEDSESRMKSCCKARMQASISPPIWQKLVAAATNDGSSLQVIEGFEVEKAIEDDNKWKLQLQRNNLLTKEQQQQPTAFQIAIAAEETASTIDSVDEIWIACGSAFNTSKHSILSKLQNCAPTRLIAGYPVLDSDTCVWPGAPFYILGRAAMLAVGPTAGNLAGMRLAADKIIKSLKKLDYSGQTDWQLAAEKRASQIQFAHNSDKDSEDEQEEATVGTIKSFSVLENCLKLEEEGLMCYEKQMKPKVAAAPPNLIDVSDLPADLPRQEIQKFSFWEDDFEICITATLSEAIQLSNVRSLITERSMEIWAVGSTTAYRMYVPRLYGKVIPAKCKVKVNESKKKVFVVLYKEKDTEWRFLKGI